MYYRQNGQVIHRKDTRENFEMDDLKKPINYFLVVSLVVVSLLAFLMVWVALSNTPRIKNWLPPSPSWGSPANKRLAFKFY